MHLLVHSHSHAIGGHEIALKQLLQRLRENFDVRVSLVSQPCRSATFLKSQAHRVLRAPKTLEGWSNLIARIRPCAILAGTGRSPALLAAAHARQTPSLWMLPQTAGGDPLFRETQHLLGILAKAVVVPSRFCAEDLAPQFHSKTHVIPNGIDTGHFYPPSPAARGRARAQLGYGENSFVLGYSARFVPQKRHDFLFPLLRGLRQKGIPAHLLLLGRTDTHSQRQFLGGLKKKAKQAGLLSWISFKSVEFEQAPSLLAALDLYVSPSLEESFGLATLEAMAMKIPCVVAKSGAVGELVTEDAACLFLPQDAQSLLRTVEGLWRSPKSRVALARRGRRYVQKNFPLDKMAERYWELIKA